jgi:predicted GIY-YIG superfamily endonuclease
MKTDIRTVSVEARPAAYVLQGAAGGDLYKGACRDLQRRLRDHAAGRVAHTKNHRPLVLVYFDYQPDFTAARQRENFFKSGAGRAFLCSLS